jgi:hypothetical protein
MNPLKRKKFYRLELAKQKNNLVIQETKQEKPVEVFVQTIVSEPVKLAEVIQEPAAIEAAALDMGLSLINTPVEQQITDAVTTENKKEKKKKYSSQD